MEEVGIQLEQNPQLKALLNDFVSNILLHKPNDVYSFTKNYFSKFHETTQHNNQKAVPIVICGPSGVGKGTIIEMLQQEFPDKFGFSVSHTTRKPRTGEVDGIHYHFTTVEQIQKEIKEGKFVENANVHGNLYGTSKEAIDVVLKSGKICILDIDVQGADQVKKSSLKPYYVFIAPPSLADLEQRLRGRKTETEESIQKRLRNAVGEIDYMNKPGFWDLIIINDDLSKTYETLKTWLFRNDNNA